MRQKGNWGWTSAYQSQWPPPQFPLLCRTAVVAAPGTSYTIPSPPRRWRFAHFLKFGFKLQRLTFHLVRSNNRGTGQESLRGALFDGVQPDLLGGSRPVGGRWNTGKILCPTDNRRPPLTTSSSPMTSVSTHPNIWSMLFIFLI